MIRQTRALPQMIMVITKIMRNVQIKEIEEDFLAGEFHKPLYISQFLFYVDAHFSILKGDKGCLNHTYGNVHVHAD